MLIIARGDSKRLTAMKQYYFVFCGEELLLEKLADGSFTVPMGEEPPTEVKPWTVVMNVGQVDGTEVMTYTVPSLDGERPSSPLRQCYYRLPRELYLMAAKCAELLYWERNTRFCGTCGGPMRLHTAISKRCEHCGREVWPQVSPAIIVRITRGTDEILMARARNFRGDFYGLIAGFVETGETLEEAVHREVMEETGLTVSNLRYFGSQPWPFPSGLMVGYTADYSGGTIRVQREELSNVAWFHRDHLPKLPEKLSIARWLIDDWTGEQDTPQH